MKEDRIYKITYYRKLNGKIPVLEYIKKIPLKDQIKILSYIDNLSVHADFRQKPYSRQLKNKIRELKVDFSENKHRIIYFFNIGKVIILLHTFKKKSAKIPFKEIKKAKNS